MARRRISTFGTLLREYRQAAGLSQEELAERSGLSARGISDLERGARTMPRLETVRMLADGLGLQDTGRVALFASRSASQDLPRPERSIHAQALPSPATPLVGRELEITTVVYALQQADVRLITLIGPGGVGKTRLALEIAHEVVHSFPDGVLFIDYTTVRDPDLVLPTIAATVGVRDTGTRPLADVLIGALQDRSQLLVLDNLEQVVDASLDLAMLLAACPALKILATSRVRLRLAAEHLFSVNPLMLPERMRTPSLEELHRTEAIALFVDRAQAADPDFRLTEENRHAVAALVERLEGLPLAIELAAARITVLQPEALLARLEQRLPLLTGGHRDAPARQQTMRDAIAWSYDLLSEPEQALLRRLAVFIGGFTVEAAEEVTGSGADTLEGLFSLIDKSLLRHVDSGDGSSRFGMLEMVREFALERLAESGEEHLVRQQHAAYYRALAIEIRPRIESADGLETLRRLEAEHDNLRAALTWALTGKEAEQGLRLAGALWKFWLVRGHFREGRRWLEAALAVRKHTSAPAQMEVLYGLSGMARVLGEQGVAEKHITELLDMAEASNDPWNAARARFVLALITVGTDEQKALELLEQALAGSIETGDTHMQAMMLSSLGQVLWRQEHPDRAVMLMEQALSIWRERGDRWGIAIALSNLGDMMSETDDDHALVAYKESLRLYHELEDKGGIADSLVRLTGMAARNGQAVLTATLLGAADSIRADAGIRLHPESHADTHHPADQARAVLGDAGFTDAWLTGKRSSLADVIEQAATVQTRQHQDPRVPNHGEPVINTTAPPMTEAELQVLRLLTEGYSDQVIAETLALDRHTVANHVAAILDKLGVDSRSRAAAVAIHHKLVGPDRES